MNVRTPPPGSSTPDRLILCADDFAYSHGISETIAELAQVGKLNATSCMTCMPGWAEDSTLLAALPPSFQIGLHLTLTGERALTGMPDLTQDGSMPAIGTLQRRAAAKALPLAQVAAEISAQFDRFEDSTGRTPDFVDGHQHSHALPGIREIVLEETARRAPRAWIRDCTDRLPAMLARPFAGKAIASAFHSRGLSRAAAQHGLACNDSFAGHYGFAGNFGRIFPKFLRRPGACHLVMCHPGAGRLSGDTIAEARVVEADALRYLPVAELAAAHGLVFPG